MRKYFLKNLKIGLRQNLVSSVPSRNKTLVIVVKNYAKVDVKVSGAVQFKLIYLLYSKYFVQDCSCSCKNFEIWLTDSIFDPIQWKLFILLLIFLNSFSVSKKSHNLRYVKKCPHSELFWSVFSRSRTEYGEILFTQCYLVPLETNWFKNDWNVTG